MPFRSDLQPTSHEGPLRGLSILVVEDHLDSLELLTEALVELGAKVYPAATTREAFALLLEHEPHLVVSDIGLPDEDGYSFMRRIRALSPEHGGSTPGIAVSAFTSAEARTLALAAGFQAFLAKPMDLSKLTRSIRSLVPSPP